MGRGGISRNQGFRAGLRRADAWTSLCRCALGPPGGARLRGSFASGEDVAGRRWPLGGAVRAWGAQVGLRKEARSWSCLLLSVISQQEVGAGKKPSSPFSAPPVPPGTAGSWLARECGKCGKCGSAPTSRSREGWAGSGWQQPDKQQEGREVARTFQLNSRFFQLIFF